MKKLIRKEILQRRDLLSEREGKEKSRIITERLFALDEYKSSKSIFCFLSFGSEFDTKDLLEDALKTKDVYVPYINKNEDKMHPVLIKSLDNFIINKFGIREPEFDLQARLPEVFDLVVVPGVAFDREGHRIGYGKGYYDKFLNAYSVTSKIATVFSMQVIEKVPCENHDVPVHMIITEKESITVF